MNRLASLTRIAACVLLVPLLAGCAKTRDVFTPNVAPEVRLTAAPIASTDLAFYALRMNWVGYDPDGRVDYFLFAVDPPDPGGPPDDGQPDSIWQRTPKNEEILFFKATTSDSVGKVRSTDYHTFAIAAVDNQSKVSAAVWRSFNSYTIAPFTRIEEPTPNQFFTPSTTPTMRVRWRGQDDDGQFTTKPIKYKYRLFAQRDPDFEGVTNVISEIVSQPRILFWKYAPPIFGPNPNCPNCSYWDSIGGETTEVQFTNLTPDAHYIFAVTGFDEAGAYDPVFSPHSNLLRFAVTYAGKGGPLICMFNEFFEFCYASGGYANDPTRYFNVEVPADQKVTFNWRADPPPGADIRFYRWAMDLNDLSDETRRTNESTDWYHWSVRSLQNTSATVGPFDRNGEEHLFYIECEDNNGLRSLGIIRFTVVRATFDEEPILFVDDTRLQPDQLTNSGTLAPPRGLWPTGAELDTFFFAQGGYPWKGYPVGSDPSRPGEIPLSPRGIFAGYDFDSMSTRGTLTGITPLARLGKHRLVVWYVDANAATYTEQPFSLLSPVTSLRRMSSAGNPSTISTYIKQGGKVWLFGGGASFATLTTWDKRNTPPDEFTNRDGELVPGRFMYDFANWQAGVTNKPAGFALANDSVVLSLFFGPNTEAMGRGYTAHGPKRDLSMPDYARLAANVPQLNSRNPTDDPVPPQRFPDSIFYVEDFIAEFMGTATTRMSNIILEDTDPHPDIVHEESTLDTLYLCAGQTAPFGRPMMTYYHGFRTDQVVFSGFPLWHFSRPQAQYLADFVLQDIFGMEKSPPPPRPAVPTQARFAPPARIQRTATPQGVASAAAPR